MVEQACISRDATGRQRPPLALFCLFVAMIACPASLAANEPTGTQIVAPRTLKVEAPGQINFDVRVVAPRGVVPSFSIVIRGLPVSVKLSAGEAIGSNTWKVPVLELADLKMTLMAGAVGKSDLELTLVTSRDVVLARASSELTVEAASVIQLSTATSGEGPTKKDDAATARGEKPAAGATGQQAASAGRIAVSETLPARGAAEQAEKSPEDPLGRQAARNAEEVGKLAEARAEEARKAEEAERLALVEEAKKATEAGKLDEARKAGEAEQAMKAEEVRKLAEARAEEARKAEEAEKLAAAQQARKAAENRKLAEAKADEARKAEEAEKLAAMLQAEKARKAAENRKLAEAKAEEARRTEEAEKAAATQRAEQARKAEEARELAEARAEQARKAGEARALAKGKAEQARKAEEAETFAQAEEAKRVVEARKLEQTRKAAEAEQAREAARARKLAEAKAELARKAEEAREFAEARAQQARKLAEAKGEEARKAEAQAQQISSSLLTAASGMAVAALPDQRQDPQPTVTGPTHAASTTQRPQSERLFSLGERYRAEGNIVVARQYFLRAAQLGLASAAFKLAVTYDPYELERLNTRGLNADLAEAKRWYARAAEFGAEDAKARLVRLGEK